MLKSLILASASPRRQELLNQIGLKFITDPSDIDEDMPATADFGNLVAELALRKALAVSGKYENGIILGADTIVVLDNEIFGKPADRSCARKMLSRLSGCWHSVFTGVALVDAATSHSINQFEESQVKFKNLTESEIQNYIDSGEPMDKAGAYGIQGKGALFVEKICGDYYNIVGLPLFRLNNMLKSFGINLL